MNARVTTNFGAINHRRVVTFKVTNDGFVVPAKHRKLAEEKERMCEEIPDSILIPAHETFRRWKIARKAWRSRKWRNQLAFDFRP